MEALLPPSSRMARAKRRASRSPTTRPMRVEPVAETTGTRGSSTSASPTSRPPISDAVRDRPARRRRICAPRDGTAPAVASAVSGVFSDGFQTTGSPQTSASAAFHDQTATGKLKAEMTPTTPIGRQVSIRRWSGALGLRWSGRRAGATGRRRSRRCRSSPALRRGPRRRPCRPPA